MAERDGERLGFVSYRIDGSECEVTGGLSLRPGEGIGSALLAAVVRQARTARCRRLCVITTNDNLEAIGWYQRSGFRLAAVRPGAVNQLRATLKPHIPAIGMHRIALRDEVAFELDLERRD